MNVKDKLTVALKENNRVLEYFFSNKSGKKFGTVTMMVKLCDTFIKKKIYYNQRPPIKNLNKIKEHVSAIILTIASSTQTYQINARIDAELDIYESGLWSETEAGRIFQQLKDEGLIYDFEKTCDVDDVINSHDYLVTKNDKTKIFVDVTSSKLSKGSEKLKNLKEKGIYVLCVNKQILPKDQYNLFIKMLKAE